MSATELEEWRNRQKIVDAELEKIKRVLLRGIEIVPADKLETLVHATVRAYETLERVDLELAFDLIEARKKGEVSDEECARIIKERLTKAHETDMDWYPGIESDIVGRASGHAYNFGDLESSKQLHQFLSSQTLVEIANELKEGKEETIQK